MEKFFNTAGPVNPENHYCLPVEERLNVEEIFSLINQKKYFVLHAPRQTGKSTCLLALMDILNLTGQYRALYINVETAQAYRENVAAAMETITREIELQTWIYFRDTFPVEIIAEIHRNKSYNNALKTILALWADQSSLPLVIFIDEVDALIGDTLIAVLRQIRAGYTERPHHFPQSIILCGLRDVRDYRIHSSSTKEIITGGSAFNVKAESLRLGDFTQDDVKKLLTMHTTATGQAFTPESVEIIWDYTQGQPWLVNALAYEVCFKDKANRNRSITITPGMTVQAAENLIWRRETHLDQLADKLKEPRVRRVIQPILAGEDYPADIPEDDIQYVLDLGLIRREGQLKIANKIYSEMIPRTLVFSTQVTISHQTEWYVSADGRLDLPKLLTAFQEFFRKHSEMWLERFDYREAGPQLLLQAFLQRIINGGGRVEREYGLGTLRTDIFVLWPYGDNRSQAMVIELKIKHGSREATIEQGGSQITAYMDKCGTREGYLLIFDRTPGVSWEEKIFHETREYAGNKIPVWGM